MKHHSKALFLPLLCAAAMPIFAENNTAIWKASYYNPTPIKKNISQKYCNKHNPGIFIGNVKQQLLNGATTSNNIKLNHFTFHQQVINGIYVIYGSVVAVSLIKN